MILAGLGELGIYVFPDAPGRQVPETALAGPFASNRQAYAWAVEHLVSRMTPEQSALYAKARERAGGEDADAALLMTLAVLVRRGKSETFVLSCAGQPGAKQRTMWEPA